MPLPPPDTSREPLHTRSIRVQAFARDDGQWDLEAELIDTKAYDFPGADGSTHRAGDPVHHMHLRVTINDDFSITAATAAYDAAPYGPHCTAIAPDYNDLVGMNLLRNFRQTVKERFGRTAGCTHLTELSYVLPTVAIQSMARQRRLAATQPAQPGAKRPFQLDGCHALRVDGPVAKEFYPQWYVSPRQARRE
ncbi:MAG TPA: DUF2889 domain-containing protein [Burkholderiaceae bacterium]|nr:DUF2889 domain-containing protein [Burkholderiaceae bacterium]